MELSDLENAKIVTDPINITHITLRNTYGVSIEFTEKADEEPGTFEVTFPAETDKTEWLEFLVYCANQIESGATIARDKHEMFKDFSDDIVLLQMQPYWYDQHGAKHSIIFTTPES